MNIFFTKEQEMIIFLNMETGELLVSSSCGSSGARKSYVLSRSYSIVNLLYLSVYNFLNVMEDISL